MKLTKAQRAKWFRCLAALRRELPPPVPVFVRTVKRIDEKDIGEDLSGITYLWRKHAIIRISQAMSFDEKVGTLGHEWAHVLEGLNDEHGEAWGVWYSRAYRVLEKVNGGD